MLRWIFLDFGDRLVIGSRLGFWLSLLRLSWSCGFSSCCFDCDVGGTENLFAFSAYFDRFSVCSFSEDIGYRAVNADSMLCRVTNSVAFGVDCSLAMIVFYETTDIYTMSLRRVVLPLYPDARIACGLFLRSTMTDSAFGAGA